MSTDARFLGALQTAIITGPAGLDNTAPAKRNVRDLTMIVRALTDLVCTNISFKFDAGISAPPYAANVSAGVELVGVTAISIDSGTAQIFYTTGA